MLIVYCILRLMRLNEKGLNSKTEHLIITHINNLLILFPDIRLLYQLLKSCDDFYI